MAGQKRRFFNYISGMLAGLRQDLRRGDFFRTMRRDYTELKEFFLDDARKARLLEMNWLKRRLYTSWWLFGILFKKLTPARRLLLVFVFFLRWIIGEKIEFAGEHSQLVIHTGTIQLLILLFLLMLELKDKLLAHDELQEGRAIQIALMPERSPKVPGWSVWLFTRTANEVGGDLVDLQTIGTETFRISLADVAGKGLKAALFTTKLQATLRALAPDLVTLAELGAKVNRIFHRDSLRNFFVSLVCIELKSNSGSVRMINAGHLPPVLVKGRAVEETRKGDPAIGIFRESAYNEDHVELKEGDLLIVYTDGLTEAKNENDEFFGTQRLLNLLPLLGDRDAADAGEMLVREVDRFIGHARAYDDLSLVILKRT